MRGRALEAIDGNHGDAISGGMRLGRIVAVNDDSRVLVEFDGCAGPTVARLAIEVTKQRLKRAIIEREIVVLGFEVGDLQRPIALGLVTLPAALPAPGNETSEPRAVVTADVDGRRVRIEGQDEIVLQCGKASVTLRRNGKVVIRGTQVETQAEGTNRIKGGQVRIN